MSNYADQNIIYILHDFLIGEQHSKLVSCCQQHGNYELNEYLFPHLCHLEYTIDPHRQGRHICD